MRVYEYAEYYNLGSSTLGTWENVQAPTFFRFIESNNGGPGAYDGFNFSAMGLGQYFNDNKYDSSVKGFSMNSTQTSIEYPSYRNVFTVTNSEDSYIDIRAYTASISCITAERNPSNIPGAASITADNNENVYIGWNYGIIEKISPSTTGPLPSGFESKIFTNTFPEGLTPQNMQPFSSQKNDCYSATGICIQTQVRYDNYSNLLLAFFYYENYTGFGVYQSDGILIPGLLNIPESPMTVNSRTNKNNQPLGSNDSSSWDRYYFGYPINDDIFSSDRYVQWSDQTFITIDKVNGRYFYIGGSGTLYVLNLHH